jgi:phosphatidylserine/phosphatidylglycerophosphate/cardiolipin synthase-like enzyme
VIGPPAVAGPHAVQVLRTYPAKRPPSGFAPKGERSIARVYIKAFRRARRLIYVEDQYFWSHEAARQLGRALRQQPELLVAVVVPKFPDENGWFTGPPNRVGQVRVIDHLREIAGPRLAVYNIEVDQQPIYVHAKICIIDDVWMSVGSDNFNRRSWSHDSELSCAILDDTRDAREPTDPAGLGDGARRLTRSTRLALWEEHLGRTDVPIDPSQGFAMLREAADALDDWHNGGRLGPKPPGRLRHHRPAPIPTLMRPFTAAFYRFMSDPDGRPWASKLRRHY